MAKQGTALTLSEKYTIRGMVQDGYDAKTIAKELKRTPSTISKYIENELSNFVGLQTQNELITKEIYDQVLNKLIRNSLSEMDARGCINKVRDKLLELEHLQVHKDNVDWLVEACMRQTNASQMIAKQTANKQKGVAILTKGASERMDLSRTERGAGPSRFDGCIHRQ